MAGNKPGRRPGLTKEVVQSRKVLDKFDDLREKVAEDVVEAYDVIAGVMRNEDAAPATRRQCAGDIISLYQKVHKDSIEVVREFEQNSENPSEYAEKAEEQKGGKEGSNVLNFDKVRDKEQS